MNIIADIFSSAFSMVKNFISRIVDKFIEINFFDKLIVVNIIIAFFAIVLPSGRFYIFETWYPVNNPLAVYLLGIVAVMIATLYFPGRISSIVRVVLNLYYLIWVFYIHLGPGMVKTQYELRPGYYLNIIAPVLFAVFAVFSHMFSND